MHLVVVSELSLRPTGNDTQFLPPANEVWGKDMFLHVSVILFTGRGVSGTPPGRYTPLGRYTPRQVHPPPAGAPPSGRYPPLQVDPAGTPPQQCMLGYGQQAGGTHPTGMHSCFKLFLRSVILAILMES